MNPEDLALFRQLGAWAEELTGYPMVSGCEEFLYEPDTPLHGDLTDYAYYQRGAIGYVVELWDLFKQAGLERKKRFVDNYTHLTRDDMMKIGAWDRDKNAGRSIRPWRKVTHPQLGEVEVGGIDPRVGLWNPPPEEMRTANFTRSFSSRWGISPRNFSKYIIRCRLAAVVSSHRNRRTASTVSAISRSFCGSRMPRVRRIYRVLFHSLETRWSPLRNAVSSFQFGVPAYWAAMSVRESITIRLCCSPV
jgi:hypothetical protein